MCCVTQLHEGSELRKECLIRGKRDTRKGEDTETAECEKESQYFCVAFPTTLQPGRYFYLYLADGRFEAEELCFIQVKITLILWNKFYDYIPIFV